MKRDVLQINQHVLPTCSPVSQINNAFLSTLFVTLRKVIIFYFLLIFQFYFILKFVTFYSDCNDGSDEASCKQPKCKDNEFTCDNKRCISKKWVCDKVRKILKCSFYLI